MTFDEIHKIKDLLFRGHNIAWVHEGTFCEILTIRESHHEFQGLFANGKQVDLYNVEPQNIITFESMDVRFEKRRQANQSFKEWCQERGQFP